MFKCCSFSAVKRFLWFWSLSYRSQNKQFLMNLHRTDNLLPYFDEFFNLLYIKFACVLLFIFVKIHTVGNYLVALFLLTQTNAKFKKRLCLVRVPHCTLGLCNFKRTLATIWNDIGKKATTAAHQVRYLISRRGLCSMYLVAMKGHLRKKFTNHILKKFHSIM